MDYKADHLRKPTEQAPILIGMTCIQAMSLMIVCFEKVKSNCNYLDLLLQYQIQLHPEIHVLSLEVLPKMAEKMGEVFPVHQWVV